MQVESFTALMHLWFLITGHEMVISFKWDTKNSHLEKQLHILLFNIPGIPTVITEFI